MTAYEFRAVTALARLRAARTLIAEASPYCDSEAVVRAIRNIDKATDQLEKKVAGMMEDDPAI